MLCSDFSPDAFRRRPGLVPLLAIFFACVATVCKGSTITEFPAPASGSQPYSIIHGPDGAFWFANFGTNNFCSIGRIAPDGTATNYIITPNGRSRPYGLAVGPDNNIWFTEAAGNKIGRMSSTNGTMIAEYAVRTNNAGIVPTTPGGIVLGPDGRLWFTEYLGNAIGAITLGSGTNVTITEYTNGLPAGSGPYNIAVGPDGNMWFTENVVGKIGKMTTGGTLLTNFPLLSTSEPLDIIAGPDGALWFTEFNSGVIGRVSTNVASTNLTEYPLPTAGAQPYGLALGADGNIWFAEYAASRIGHIALNGTNATFAEVPTPTLGSAPAYLAANPDGSIWFTEAAANRIGRVTDNLLSVTVTNRFLTDGMTYSGTVAGFQDSDPVTGTISQYSATINWGDGTTNAGTIVTNTSGGFKVNGTHTYGTPDGYQVVVTITDNDTTHDMGGGTATATFSINLLGLKIRLTTNAQAVVSWPATFTGFQLQSNTNLSTTNWMTVTNPQPVVVGTNFTVTNAVIGNSFYRLKK